MRNQRLFFVVGVATLGLGQTVSNAQEAQSGFLEEVIVTAQKRSQNLQKVSFAVNTFDANQIEELQINDTVDLTHYVPGFVVNSIAGTTAPIIRGLGVRSSGPWQEPAVGTYIDGVYHQHSTMSNLLLNNLQRVEVLKGPQGTLFGRNANGGVLSYVTKDPQHSAGADFNLGFANYNAWDGDFYATTGITDNLAADIAITGQDHDGWGTNLYSGADVHSARKYGVRSKWVLNVSDETKFTFIGDYSYASADTAGVGAMRGNYPHITIGPSHVGGFHDVYLPTEPYTKLTTYGVSIRAEHDFGWGHLMSLTAGRRDVEQKNLPYAGWVVPYLPETPGVGQIDGIKVETSLEDFSRTFTQEFQLTSPETSPIEWIGGVYLLFNEAGFNYKNNNRTSGDGLINDRNYTSQDTESYSAYFQTSIPIFTNSRLVAGARYTSDHRSVWGYAERNSVDNQDVYTLIPGRSHTDNPVPSDTWTKPIYKLALEHDFSDRIFAYASFSTGFQSAFYNISSRASSPPLEPETLDAYEVGIKGDLFDHRLRANLSVYYYDLDNVIVAQVVEGSNVTKNAAKSEIPGVDLDLTLAPTENLTLRAGMSYQDPVFTDYANAERVQPNADGTAWELVGPFDNTGLPIENTEKFMGVFSVNYVIPTQNGDFSIFGSAANHSGIRFDSQDFNTHPSYTIANATLGWTSPDARWDVMLFGKNLTDEKTAMLFPNTSIMMYTVQPPRTYGIRFGYHYN